LFAYRTPVISVRVVCLLQPRSPQIRVLGILVNNKQAKVVMASAPCQYRRVQLTQCKLKPCRESLWRVWSPNFGLQACARAGTWGSDLLIYNTVSRLLGQQCWFSNVDQTRLFHSGHTRHKSRWLRCISLIKNWFPLVCLGDGSGHYILACGTLRQFEAG
jgi:hypothetical protein